MAESKVKLTYFDGSGKAEIIRLVLVAARKEFEDVRIDLEKWPEVKPTTPFGQLPVLELDGKKYGQALAIATFFAREFGYYGKTNLEGLMIDQVVQLMDDYFRVFSQWYLEEEETKKEALAKRLSEEVGPWLLNSFEKLIKENGSGNIVGDRLTLADLVVFDACTGFFSKFLNDTIPKCPLVEKLVIAVGNNERIKTYMITRQADNF